MDHGGGKRRRSIRLRIFGTTRVKLGAPRRQNQLGDRRASSRGGCCPQTQFDEMFLSRRSSDEPLTASTGVRMSVGEDGASALARAVFFLGFLHQLRQLGDVHRIISGGGRVDFRQLSSQAIGDNARHSDVGRICRSIHGTTSWAPSLVPDHLPVVSVAKQGGIMSGAGPNWVNAASRRPQPALAFAKNAADCAEAKQKQKDAGDPEYPY
jgi:hypothetical protein